MPAEWSPRKARSGVDSPMLSTNSLRILVVDDNHVNLAVLKALLKQRFGELLACPPVALDSGLKAIKALRTDVFDLIFMDIEMPYLDGVECTRRIRAAEDGILTVNSNAHIVAVTTNVGDVPGVLYRQVGMNGMISKPVRFEQFRQYIYPLSLEARQSHDSVSPLLVGQASVMPPMPPTRLDNRSFFTALTTEATRPTTAKVLSDGSNEFAAMLKAQTTKSLSDRKAVSLARAGDPSLPRRSSFNSPRSEHLTSIRSTLLQQSVPASQDSFEVLVDLEADSQDRLKQTRHSRSFQRLTSVHQLSSPTPVLKSLPSSDSSSMVDEDVAVPKLERPCICPLDKRRSSRDFDPRASSSSTWSNTQLSGATTDSDTRDSSPSSAITTPLSSPVELELDWQDMFSKAVFSPCADDATLSGAKASWDEHECLSAPLSGRQSPCAMPLLEPPTRPFTAQSA